MIFSSLLIVSVVSVCLGDYLPPITEFNPVFDWSKLEFGFPTKADKKYAIANGLYGNGFFRPAGVDFHSCAEKGARVFITVPRLSDGIPYTLATVSNKYGSTGPILQPYPSYEWHSSYGADCDGLTSVFRISTDECNRLWVVDTGRIINSTGSTQNCPPQILAFNLKTDELLYRYKMPEGQYVPNVSMLSNVLVDVIDPLPYGTCQKTKLYLSDPRNSGLVVYDAETNDSWLTKSKYYAPEEKYINVTIAGESFVFPDGIYAVALTPKRYKGERMMYFHAHASEKEIAVPLSLINSKEAWLGDPESNSKAFKILGRRGTQSSAMAMDSRGNLFAGLIKPIALYVWNIKTPYKPENFKILYNPETLQFTTDAKIIRDPFGRECLWILTNRAQKFYNNSISASETNLRIQNCYVDDLLNGLPCF